MAPKRILLLCGDYMEDSEVLSSFSSSSPFYTHSSFFFFHSVFLKNLNVLCCRPWFHSKHCKLMVSPSTPFALERKPAMSAAPPSISFPVTRSLLHSQAFDYSFSFLGLVSFSIVFPIIKKF